MSPEGSLSGGWRETYRQMGADPDDWDDDPLENLRDREEELEQIAASDAPDAPVARIMLALMEGEDVPREEIATLHPEGAGDA